MNDVEFIQFTHLEKCEAEVGVVVDTVETVLIMWFLLFRCDVVDHSP